MRKLVVERAECHDCGWTDDAGGARGRGAQHAHRTGHKVTTSKTTVYPRQSPDPNQLRLV